MSVFADQAAIDRHNASIAVARFVEIAKPILDGDVTLITAEEISAEVKRAVSSATMTRRSADHRLSGPVHLNRFAEKRVRRS